MGVTPCISLFPSFPLLGVGVQTVTRFALACLSIFAIAGCDRRANSTGAQQISTISGTSVPARAPDALALAGAVPTFARFIERTAHCGVHFTYRNDEQAGNFAILESLGGGAALLDYDRDGHLDLFIAGGGFYSPPAQVRGFSPALYRNLVGWEFQDITEMAAVDRAKYYSHAVAAGDCDNDGFPDAIVTGYGGVMFFHNQGDGTFVEAAESARLLDELWSSSAAWGDFDRDGDLDLYIAHYVDWSFRKHPFCKGPRPELRDVCPPRKFEALPHVLYINEGDGTFRDASVSAGLRTDGKGLGVVAADVDLDGNVDIYVSNDTVPNFLYRNTGSGHFVEAGLQSGTGLNDVGTPDGSMGTDVGDFNGDGLPDIWVVNFERESFALYRNEGDFMFQHISQSTGVTALGATYVGWGTVFLDFDRDGDEDIFVSSGHVVRYPTNAPLKQQPLLLQNEGGLRIINVSAGAGAYFAEEHMGRGVALGDIDDDGDLDLVIVHTNDPVSLLSNESPNDHHWIALRLIGTRSSRDPIGAFVRIYADSGMLLRQVKGGGSYASTGDLRIFAGLGSVAHVQRVEIHWPSGREQILTVIPVDRCLTVIEPPE